MMSFNRYETVFYLFSFLEYINPRLLFHFFYRTMAKFLEKIFTRLGTFGLAVAATGSAINSAIYNGIPNDDDH